MHSEDESRENDNVPSKRRQNRSCDHCRSGKRRCDVRYKSGDPSPPPPCTNCKRWKKVCTVEWIKAREQNPPSRAANRQRRKSSARPSEHMVSAHAWSSNDTTWSGSPECYRPQVSANGRAIHGDICCAASIPSVNNAVVTEDFARPSTEIDGSLFSPSQSVILACSTFDGNLDQSNERKPNADCSVTGIDFDLCSRSSPNLPLTPTITRSSVSEKEQAERRSWSIRDAFIRPTSPFSAQFLADDYNRLHINQSLLKIYHDSLEGALSCWLTERNCPYSFSSFDGKDAWGSRWASRMVKRVCSLDNEYSKAGLLSKLDHKEGSKVLNLVVLAFAAQWAQTGQRYDQPERFASCTSPCDASNGLETHTSPIHFLEEESFGRDTQKTLWYQANRALRAASDNNSFQAIFAGIIFSLTQRPIDSTEVLLDLNTGEQDELASLFNVLDIDGPTVTLDIALRKLHDHQRRLQGSRHPGVYGAKAPRGLSADHMETFGLLYWLAVMFDTLSAAMNRRSFTISDADTSVSRSERKLAAVDSHHVQSPSSTPDDADVWGDYFLREQSYVGDVRKTTARWPCDYVDAASCLADAAPVKVLLYRRLGHLQSLFYQRAPAQEIEESLEAAMEVYNHWNSTYALFIDDCIRNHEDLPARIQSWYTLLCGHWNLAVLMLLDLIDTLDNAEMTMPTHRHLRQEIHFTGPLRETAVAAISELGRCCCSGSVEEPLAFSQSPDFHSAVSKAALLTEPWTVVLVRAYGYAGAILANRLRSEVYEVADMDVVASAKTRERLRYCIEGLHLLGKKSDMALCAAELLSRAATT